MTLLHFHIKSTDIFLIKALCAGGGIVQGPVKHKGNNVAHYQKGDKWNEAALFPALKIYMAAAIRKMSHNQTISMTYVQDKLLTQALHICESTSSDQWLCSSQTNMQKYLILSNEF